MMVDCPQCEQVAEYHSRYTAPGGHGQGQCLLCRTSISVRMPWDLDGVDIQVSTLGLIPEEVAAAYRLGGYNPAVELLYAGKTKP